MVVMRHVGHVTRTIAAPGPPWDRIVALVLGLNLAANSKSLNCCSVRLAILVFGCQVRNHPDSEEGGLALNKHFAPGRRFETLDSGHLSGHLSGNISCSSQTQTLRFSFQLHHQTSCHVWVAGKHHGDSGPHCTAQPQPSHGQRQVADTLIPASHWSKSTSPQHWGPTPSQSSRAHHKWEVVFLTGSRSWSCRRMRIRARFHNSVSKHLCR